MLRLASEQPLLVTLEESTVAGGFGTQVALALTRPDGAAGTRLLQLGLPDCYIEHGAREELLAAAGLSPQGVAEQVRARLRRCAPESAHPAAGRRRWSTSTRPGEPVVGG